MKKWSRHTEIKQHLHRTATVYLRALPGRANIRRQKVLKRFFELSNGFLQDIGIDYWITYGTLLGHYRDGGMIKNEYDIDYATTTSQFSIISENLDKLPKELGLFDSSIKHNGPKLYFSYKGFDADLYFYEEKGDLMYPTLNSEKPSEMVPLSTKFALPPKHDSFIGFDTKIPSNSKRHLEEIYGYIGRDPEFDKATGLYYPKGGPKPKLTRLDSPNS